MKEKPFAVSWGTWEKSAFTLTAEREAVSSKESQVLVKTKRQRDIKKKWRDWKYQGVYEIQTGVSEIREEFGLGGDGV